MRARITIDGFRPEDAPKVRSLMRRSQGVAYPADLFAVVAQEQGQRLRIARAKRTGAPVGVAMAARPPGAGDLFLLSVDPRVVGRGVRRRLLAELEAALGDDGEPGLAVEVPLADRETAAFLEREGFRVLDVEPARDGNEPDRVVLGKRFAATAGRGPRWRSGAAVAGP